MRDATHGPAFLDTINGVAHKDEDCPGFVYATCQAEASDGPMGGFVWCDRCVPVSPSASPPNTSSSAR